MAAATSRTAENCGKPTPATILVVQMEPGPIPTFTPSAPFSTKYLAASGVAMFPTITSNSGNLAFTAFKTSTTPFVCPWAVSIITASTPAFTKAVALSTASAVTPKAAATLKRPNLSLLAFGFWVNLVISLKVIKPTNSFLALITGNFSILCPCKTTSACSKDVPSATVTKFSLVIISIIGLVLFFSKRKSLLVTIPFKILFSSTIGIPPIPYSFIAALASATVDDKGKVTGSIIIPDSARFTLRTLVACCSIVIFLCKTPIPPSCAMAIAISLSVTVSMAADTIGTLSVIFLENFDLILTSRGSTFE